MEEYRQMMIRHGAETDIAYDYKQLTSGQLKQCRPAAGQNGFESVNKENKETTSNICKII